MHYILINVSVSRARMVHFNYRSIRYVSSHPATIVTALVKPRDIKGSIDRVVSSFVLVTALLALAVLVSSSTCAILYFYPIFDVRSSLTIDKKIRLETLCSSALLVAALEWSNYRVIAEFEFSFECTQYLIESRFSLLTL
jgi:hypothetical protein